MSEALSRPQTPLSTPDAWLGERMAQTDEWRHCLSEEDVGELVAAAAHGLAKPPRERTPQDFPLPTLSPRVAGWLREIEHGRGFVLIRGFPVRRYSQTVCEAVYWGLGLHLGRAISQNTDGDLLGHVRDTGADPKAYGVRLYKTRAEQDFHTDGADIVGLFCLRPARSGGISRIVSSPSIYNRMLAQRPDLIPAVFETFPFDTQGQHRPGEQPWFDRPICRWDAGRLSTFFIPWYIRESQQHPEAPRLTEAQAQAVAFIEAAANDPTLYLDMDFRPGDIQLLRNASVLHKRTAYEDWDDPDEKRHLLRLWLSTG